MTPPPTYLNELGRKFQEINFEHGFGDADPWASFGEKIALLHSELSEALEEWRNWNSPLYFNPDKPTKPEGVGAELADVLIRLVDLASALDIDLDHIVVLKMEYNRTRSFRHGGKRA